MIRNLNGLCFYVLFFVESEKDRCKPVVLNWVADLFLLGCRTAGKKKKEKLNANNILRSEMEEKIVHTFVDVQGCSFNQTLLYFHVNSRYLGKKADINSVFWPSFCCMC